VSHVVTVIEIDQAAVDALLTGGGSPVIAAVERGAGRGRDMAKMNLTAAGRIDTGTLRNSVESVVTTDGSTITGRIGTDVEYATFIHEGTQGPIVPTRARVLRFKPKGSAEVLFRPEVAGITATPFLRDALDSLSLADFL